MACWGTLIEGYSVKEFRDNQRCLVEGVAGSAGHVLEEWRDKKEDLCNCNQGSVC